MSDQPSKPNGNVMQNEIDHLHEDYRELLSKYDKLEEKVNKIETEKIPKINENLATLSSRLTNFNLFQGTLATVESAVAALMGMLISLGK